MQGERARWWNASRWPPPATDVRWYLGPGRLTTTRTSGTLVYGDPGVSADAQLVLRTPPMPRHVRIAGQPFIRLRYSLAGGGDTTFAYRLVDEQSGLEIASGYARGSYRDEIRGRGPSWPTTPEPHQPEAVYRITFPFVYTDYMLARGHRLALYVRSDDNRVLGGGTAGRVTLHLDGSYLVIPDAASRLAERRRAWAAVR